MVMTGQRQPGPDFCNGVARALRIPPERIFRLAGLLPPIIIGQEEEEELLGYFHYLPTDDRCRLLTIARALHEEHAAYNPNEEEA